MELATRRYDSPLGTLTLVASAAGLRAILWPDDRRSVPGAADVSAETSPADGAGTAVDVLDATTTWLDAYFAGDSTPPAPPLDLVGTEFQRAVWSALADVPPGTTTTYAALAAAVGRPGAARAVGAAVGRNPVSVLLGCHRVVGANGSLTGFAGGLPTKRWLLDHESQG